MCCMNEVRKAKSPTFIYYLININVFLANRIQAVKIDAHNDRRMENSVTVETGQSG